MADDAKAASSAGPRGFALLPPVEDAPHHSRWRRARPGVPPPGHKVAPHAPRPASNPPAKLEHRKSTMSLLTLFSRPRVERARGHHESGLPTVLDRPEPAEPTARSPVPAAPPPASKPMEPRTLPPKPRRGSVSKKSRMGATSNWEPPPLFQAYPQAIKHAILQASNASAEAIIRTQAHRKQHSVLHEKMESKLELPIVTEEAPDPDVKKRERLEKRMSASSSQGTPDLTQKVYVLATSGCLLQYSGEGPSDRLPEKVLRLGKDSAAFACDLIPGKHWVLQISQAANDDGTMAAQQPRSLLSRLRMQGPATKKTATSLLLVFGNADEMGSWLAAVRREIDILAGRRSRSDVDLVSGGAQGDRKPNKVPSHRFLVQRDPGRFDSERSPIHSPVGSPSNPGPDWPPGGGKMHRNASDATTITSRFGSTRRSTETSSMATTVVSYDPAQLNQLREGSRLSMVSSRTAGTSPGTSIGPPSPVRDTTPLPENDGQRSPTQLKSFSMSPTGANSRRRSMPMQPLPPTSEPRSPQDTRPVRSQRYSSFGPALNGSQDSQAPPCEEKASTVARPLKNRMSFSRPFNVQPNTDGPLPAIRSFSAPPAKSSVPAGQALSTDSSESAARPISTIGGLPSAATLSSHSINRQTPSPNPGFRSIPIRPPGFLPPRRVSSLGPALPVNVNVNHTPAFQRASPRPQPSHQFHPPSQITTPPPSKPPTDPLPEPPKQPLPATLQQLQLQSQHTLRRPNSMQIRREPAAFLSTRHPMSASAQAALVRSVSLAHGNDLLQSAQPPRPPSAGPAPGSGAFAQSAAQAAFTATGQQRPRVHPRRSMPVLGLPPPPAPPPNMPLPAPPPDISLPAPPTSAGAGMDGRTAVVA